MILYSPGCPDQETVKGPFGLRVKPHLAATYVEGFKLLLYSCTSNKEAVNINFYSDRFDQTGTSTRGYRFGSRRSITSTTDRFDIWSSQRRRALF